MELTRTEIEEQIKNIDLILEKCDSLIQFLWEYEDEDIHIYNSKALTEDFSTFENTLMGIKSELEII